mmetsp:Transcript_53541/g.138475  ORF Transcript_53541/g.138475 Transcript_53541/m.138475 type:complete len:211 (+) Transcript_53541:189-821(+)
MAIAALLVGEHGALPCIVVVHDRGEAEVLAQLILALQAGIAHGRRHARAQETRVQLQNVRGRPEVHEREAAVDVAALVEGHVEERVPVVEAEADQVLDDVLPGANLRDVAHHDRGARVMPGEDPLGNDVEFGEVLGVHLLAHGLVGRLVRIGGRQASALSSGHATQQLLRQARGAHTLHGRLNRRAIEQVGGRFLPIHGRPATGEALASG